MCRARPAGSGRDMWHAARYGAMSTSGTFTIECISMSFLSYFDEVNNSIIFHKIQKKVFVIMEYLGR